MELKKEQYEEIAECFPKQRREAKITNIEILNAVLYALENGCKWRGMPEKYWCYTVKVDRKSGK